MSTEDRADEADQADGADRADGTDRTDGTGPGDGTEPDGGTERGDGTERTHRHGPTDRSVPGGDAGLVLAVMVGLYVGFALLSWLLAYDLDGLLSALQQVTFLAAVYAMLALALNLQWGYTGLFNIGVAGFMAVGVYTMAMLTGPVDPGVGGVPGLGLPLVVGIVGGMVAAALVGAVAALPALRLDADYLAIVTIGLAEIIRLTYNSPTFEAFSTPAVRIPAVALPFGIRIGDATLLPSLALGTGGATGIGLPTNPINAIYYTDPASPASPPTTLGGAIFEAFAGIGIEATTVVGWTYTLVLVGFVGLFYLLLARTGNSPFGRVLKAIRDDELVASSLGKDTRRFKITAFMLGCALMGLAGVLWQGSRGSVNPGSFRPILTFYVFIALMIGGAGSNTGSVIGGALFAGLLFVGPTFVARVVSESFDLGTGPTTFVDAVAPLASVDAGPLVAYTLANVSSLRFVLVGVVLIYLMQNRPEGLLGHRSEVASPIDLSRRDTTTTGERGDRGTATDGGENA